MKNVFFKRGKEAVSAGACKAGQQGACSVVREVRLRMGLEGRRLGESG